MKLEDLFLFFILPYLIIILPFTVGSLFSKRIADIAFIKNIVELIVVTIVAFIPFLNTVIVIMVICMHINIKEFINRFLPEHLKI
jgi:hypothetical protein